MRAYSISTSTEYSVIKSSLPWFVGDFLPFSHRQPLDVRIRYFAIQPSPYFVLRCWFSQQSLSWTTRRVHGWWIHLRSTRVICSLITQWIKWNSGPNTNIGVHKHRTAWTGSLRAHRPNERLYPRNHSCASVQILFCNSYRILFTVENKQVRNEWHWVAFVVQENDSTKIIKRSTSIVSLPTEFRGGLMHFWIYVKEYAQ